jgi:hypothetical protein
MEWPAWERSAINGCAPLFFCVSSALVRVDRFAVDLRRWRASLGYNAKRAFR